MPLTLTLSQGTGRGDERVQFLYFPAARMLPFFRPEKLTEFARAAATAARLLRPLRNLSGSLPASREGTRERRRCRPAPHGISWYVTNAIRLPSGDQHGT